MRKGIGNSFRIQMVMSVFGAFVLLALSTTYILFSTIKLQEMIDNSFNKERRIKAIRESLIDFQGPFLEYLSTRSSNALAQLLIDSQKLRSAIPARTDIPADRIELREREAYSLILACLVMVAPVIDENRGRSVAGGF